MVKTLWRFLDYETVDMVKLESDQKASDCSYERVSETEMRYGRRVALQVKVDDQQPRTYLDCVDEMSSSISLCL